jgi:DNA primase
MTTVVEDLLKSKNIHYTYSGRDLVTKCLNPDHDDTNPSFRIDRETGASNCFSCGFKANIFKHFGLLTNTVSIKVSGLKRKLKNVSEQLYGLDFPPGHTPYPRTFRGISVATLRKFGAFYTDKEEKLADRICFPVYDITGKINVFVGRHLNSNSNPRYINYPSGVSLNVLPSKLETLTNYIILVEGIVDMLNLQDNGIHNAICCFGTNSLFSNTREKLLPFKAQGVSKVYILFDGDKAGKEAAAKLKPIIEQENFIVEILELPDDTDPGDLTKEEIQYLKGGLN